MQMPFYLIINTFNIYDHTNKTNSMIVGIVILAFINLIIFKILLKMSKKIYEMQNEIDTIKEHMLPTFFKQKK